MLTPQIIGIIFDGIKVIGGSLIAVGVLHLTADQLTLYISTGTTIAVTLLGLAAVVGPIVRSWFVRARLLYLQTRKGALEVASANLKPGETIVLDSHDEAAALPANVVGPPAQVVDKG